MANFNPFPNKPWFLHVCCTSLLKTLWEKEKLFIKSNFSFSCSVFHLFGKLSAIFIKFKIVICQHFELGRVQTLSFGKGLRLFLIERKEENTGHPFPEIFKDLLPKGH